MTVASPFAEIANQTKVPGRKKPGGEGATTGPLVAAQIALSA
jgi:hypothetical protein